MPRPEDHIKLVHYVTNRFYKYFRISGSFDQDDLFQVGCIGLMKACRRFDENRGVKFSTYATVCIMSEILQFLRDKASSVKMSRSYQFHERINACSKSLNAVIGDSEHEFQELMSTDGDFTHIFIDDFLSQLDECEQQITKLRVHGYTQKEIASKIGWRQPHVSRALKRIQMKLVEVY